MDTPILLRSTPGRLYQAVGSRLCRSWGFRYLGLAPGAVKTAMTAADFEPGGLADWVASETPIKTLDRARGSGRSQSLFGQWKGICMQGQILTIDGGWSLK